MLVKMVWLQFYFKKNYEDMLMHPVYYLSKKTDEGEEKLSSYELEVLAVITALKKLRIFLLGIHFKIVTDCSAFQMTMSKHDVAPKIARWALLLQEFDYKIEHRAGIKMKHVDALSRAPIVATIVSQISASQKKDELLCTVMKLLEAQGTFEDHLMGKDIHNYQLCNGILYKEVDGRNLLVIPKTMQTDIIKRVHEEGHFGIKKTMEVINKQYYIPNLKSKIETFIKNCIKCILGNNKSGKQEGFLHTIPKGQTPLETYHLDHIGPMQATKKQYKHCLVITDAFSKFVWIYPVKTTSAQEVVSKLILQESIFGNPVRVVTDKGSAFRSDLFRAYCEEKNIEVILTTTGVPRSNGQVERQNQIIKSALIKMSMGKPDEWFKCCAKLQRAMNSSFQRAIGVTPFEVMFGIVMKTEILPEIN